MTTLEKYELLYYTSTNCVVCGEFSYHPIDTFCLMDGEEVPCHICLECAEVFEDEKVFKL